MTAIKIPGDLGHGGSGLHDSMGRPTLASLMVDLFKFLKTHFDGAAARAQGQIQCVAKASLVDGDNFTIGAVTFYFNVGGAYAPDGGYSATKIEMDVSAATDAASVAAIAVTAINGSAALVKSIHVASGLVLLVATTAGVAGNSAITESVANAGFLVSGLTGGRDASTFSETFEIPPHLL